MPCQAQDDNIPPPELSLLASLSVDDRQPYTTSKPTIRKPTSSEPSNVLTDLDFNLNPHISFPSYWNSYANQPRNTIIVDYDGLHGVIYKQITRLSDKYYNKMLDNFWQQSYLHPMDLDRAQRQYNLNASDWGCRWWEQRVSFWDHFPVEKGGARVTVHTIGQKSQVLALGPLAVYNTGKTSWQGWRLSLDAPEDDTQNNAISNDPNNLLKNRDLSFGIKPPKGNIYTGDYWTVSGSVDLSIRVNNLNNNGSRIRGEISILGYYGYRKIPWVDITLRGAARPLRNDYSVTLYISLLRW